MPQRPLFEDTPIEVERVLLARWRQLTPGERLEKAARMSRMARELMIADIERRFPEATAEQKLRLLAKRTLPPELFRAAYGDDPEVPSDAD